MIHTPCTALISPDGRTLLSVCDSPHVYLYSMTGGARITFTPLAQLSLPPFDPPSNLHPLHVGGALPALFCTTFSPSGSKFAVGSQEGMVAVWDVRSRKPMKVFTTDRSRAPPGGAGGMARSGNRATGAASGWFRTQGSWLGSKERQIQFRNRWKGDDDFYGGALSW
jgi:WD40 repeat protein